MERGFVFSIDAMAALVVAIAAVSMIFIAVSYNQDLTAGYKTISMKAGDEARINFYKDVSANESAGDVDFFRCAKYYRYGGADPIGFDGLSENTACEEIG